MKSPFKFLDPYDKNDIKEFFGRDRETEELYDLVTKNRITFVYGPSGTGKTSLLQCGLANAIGGSDWLPITIRRGENINDSLRDALAKKLKQTELNTDIDTAIRTLFQRYLRPVYLIFDQFEELFILSGVEDKGERQSFYDTIADILDADLPCRLLFSMREDYFGHLNEFEKTVPELYHRKIRVEPMNRENLREVVTGSCAAHQIGFGDAAEDPEHILNNMYSDKAGTHMPHVQVYLHMLYQEAHQQQDGKLPKLQFSQPVIDKVGAIKDVLARFLSEQKTEIENKLKDTGLNPPEDIVSTVLDIFVSDDGTKIPTPYQKTASNGISLSGKHAERLKKVDNTLLAACLDELTEARILRKSETEYEIAHDTLAAIIDQQRSAEQRQVREMERRIELGYREHVEAKKNGEDYYFDAGQLARIAPFLDKITLSEAVRQFLAQSDTYNTFLAEEEKKRTARELALAEEKVAIEANARKRQSFLTKTAAAVAVFALCASLFAWQKMGEAENNATKAQDALESVQKEKAANAMAEIQNLRKRALKLQKDPYFNSVLKLYHKADSLAEQYPTIPDMQEQHREILEQIKWCKQNLQQ